MNMNSSRTSAGMASNASGEPSPLLRYLNDEHPGDSNVLAEHTGTVPALPLKEPDSAQRPVTTTKITKTIINERPMDSPPAPRKSGFEQTFTETTASQQVPRAGERLEAREVQTRQIEPAHSASPETEQRINEIGVGPVALEPLTDDSSMARGAETVRVGAINAADAVKEKSAVASETIKSKTQQASEQIKSTAASAQQQLQGAQHTVQEKFNQMKTKVAETFQGDANNPGLVNRISDTVRDATNSAAVGVRRTADNISKNEAVQQTVPTVVEAATSSYYFVTAFITQYVQSFRPFALAMLQQPFYVQLIAGLSVITHGILPLLYLDKWAAHTVLQCFVLSVFLSHLIFTITGNLRLLFAAHIAMLPIMWSLFWETESQSASLANLRDAIQAGNAMSLLTHPMAIRHYTYILWTRAVGCVTTAIFTLDFAEIDQLWKRSARQRASIAHSISKRLHSHQRHSANVGTKLQDSQATNLEEATFDEIPVQDDTLTDFDSLLTQDQQRSDDDFNTSQSWSQKAESTPFDFDEFMDQSHLTKQSVESAEKPDKSYNAYDKNRVDDVRRLDNFTTNQKQYQTDAYPVSETTTKTTVEIL